MPAFRAPVGAPMIAGRVVCPRSHPARLYSHACWPCGQLRRVLVLTRGDDPPEPPDAPYRRHAAQPPRLCGPKGQPPGPPGGPLPRHTGHAAHRPRRTPATPHTGHAAHRPPAALARATPTRCTRTPRAAAAPHQRGHTTPPTGGAGACHAGAGHRGWPVGLLFGPCEFGDRYPHQGQAHGGDDAKGQPERDRPARPGDAR